MNQKTKLIILGDEGMLGRYIKTYFQQTSSNIRVIGFNRGHYDVIKDDFTKLENLLSRHLNCNSVVFNAIGIIPQASQNYTFGDEHYDRINRIFPHKLNLLCELNGAKMIHPTTDCVFTGNKGNYHENDTHDDITLYGKSKSKGEPKTCTVIRTSIIGEELRNKRSFVEWIKKNENGNVNGYTNHYWNGITCLQYAKIIEKIINRNAFWSGVRHIYSPNTVSKYELIKLISQTYNLNVNANKYETKDTINRSLMSVFNENNLLNIPPLKVQIKQMAKFHDKLYCENEEKIKNIPKHFYAYWDGSPMSFLQYLTVITFKELNPDWKITIYVPEIRFIGTTWNTPEQKNKYTGVDYFSELCKLDIEIKKINFEHIGFKNNVSEVIKSDYLRYWLLGNYGGLWSDMDIIYTKPITELFNSNLQVFGNANNIDTVICHFNNHYPVGLLMSSEKNPYYLAIHNNSLKYFNPQEYQSLGCCLLKKMFETPQIINKHFPELNILVLSEQSYLPYKWNRIDEIFVHNIPDKMNEETIGIHWFNGSQKSVEYENMIDKHIFPTSGSIYKYVNKYFDELYVKLYYAMNVGKIFKVRQLLENMDTYYFRTIKINERKLDNDTISIVMTASNRSTQTYFTLKTISNSSYKNIQIILVDDSTHDPIDYNILLEFNMHIELVIIKNKFWINPCVNYNIGFMHARGGKLIIQNAEVCHVDDVIKYVATNVNDGTYSAFKVSALPNIDNNNGLYKLGNLTFNKLNDILSLSYCWYNHPERRNEYFHFLTAITKNTFNKIKGFDIDYCLGIEWDDNALVYKIRNSNIELKHVTANVMGVHQWHETSSAGSATKNISNYYIDRKKKAYYNIHGKFLNFTDYSEDKACDVIMDL